MQLSKVGLSVTKITMLYTLGRIFFPRMIHQEKKLRARMKLVAVVCGLILAVGVSVLVVHLHQTRTRSEKAVKPFKPFSAEPAR